MKIANFRKSKLSYEEVLANVQGAVANIGWEIKSEIEIENGKIFHIFNKEIFEGILGSHIDFLGFLPSVLLVSKDGASVLVGTIDTGILKDLTSHHNHGDEKFVEKLSSDIKTLIKEITKAEDPKVKGIKLFSTKTCPYCIMEKEWFDKNNVKYELFYVDEDQKMAQYMVEKTGQMGVPATEVEFDDGDAEYIVGFDKNRLAELLGVKES